MKCETTPPKTAMSQEVLTLISSKPMILLIKAHHVCFPVIVKNTTVLYRVFSK